MKTAIKQYLDDKLPRIERSLQRFFEKLESGNGIINKDGFKKAICIPAEEAVTGGKRIRPILVYLAHDLVGGSFEQIDDLAVIPELAHKGSVVVDDIEDKAERRDGKDSLHKSYGTATALNVGSLLYFVLKLILNNVKIDDKERLEILQSYLNEGLTGHIGQGRDIDWRDRRVLPTEEEYLQMCAHKTSTLRFAAGLGAVSGNAGEKQKTSLIEIAELMGTAYQLKDDLLSLDENANDYGDDIAQGKISLMVLKTFQKGGMDAEELKEILYSKIKTQPLVLFDTRRAIEIMKGNGSIEYSEQKAKYFADKAIQRLSQDFPESQTRRIFSELIEYAISRNK